MSVELGFLLEPEVLSFDRILPSRKLPTNHSPSNKYLQIRASIEAVGLIEPLVVTPPNRHGQYILLDGHARLAALQALGHAAAACLVAKDDESYTYNNRVNRLSTVQEHVMIRRALERGVSAERLAQALNVDISGIRKRLRLLDGICPEAVELLADRQFSPDVGMLLRKMKPTRQVECVELMVAANAVNTGYAKALVAATPPALLVEGTAVRKPNAATAESMARLHREMELVQTRYKSVEQTYGQDVLNLVLARGYLQKLLENPAVHDYLERHQPEILAEFKTIVATASLEG
jgi:hypothetical protein